MNEETQQPEIEINAEKLTAEQVAEAPVVEAESEAAPVEELNAEEPVIEESVSEELVPQSESPEEAVSTSVDEQEEVVHSILVGETSDEASGEMFDKTIIAENAEPPVEAVAEPETASEEQITATRDELKPAIECLLFVADEPLPFKQLCKVLGDVSEEEVLWALSELAAEYDARSSGLEVREIAGGWRISTRPQNHEFIRKYLKSRPSARLSLPALETLAVIAYKQPITIPEILEIRGVSSSSAIKTLLEKRLIVTKGRKETVGKPMMYGTSKEFMIQFGLKDLNELPSIEDFEDLAQ